jgi:hypothetical protein
VRLFTGVSFSVSIVPFIRRFAFGREPARGSADRRWFDTHVQEKENVFACEMEYDPAPFGEWIGKEFCAPYCS